MSAVWLKLMTLLCLSCAALSGQGSIGVVWKDFGGSFTIQCRLSLSDQDSLTLQKGLKQEYDVLFIDGNSERKTLAKEFEGRLQFNGVFPNVDILIKNLTSEDTGPYWCIYNKFDMKSNQPLDTKGTSVLLVVTDTTCDPSNKNLVLVSVVICAALLLGNIICLLIWIIRRKTKTLCTTEQPRRVATNDVYEDMRGTIRR